MRVGAGTYPPADGFSISFARPADPTVVNHGAVGEGGTLTGLAVCFDTFDNGGIHVVGLNLRVDGTLVTNIPLPFVNLAPSDPEFAASIQTGARDGGLAGVTWQPLSVEYTTNGLLNVAYKGVTLLTNFVLPFSPTPGRFIVGGRTGSLWENHHIDNLRIVTLPVSGPAVILTQPASRTNNAATIPTFRVSAVGTPPLGYQWRKDGVNLSTAGTLLARTRRP